MAFDINIWRKHAIKMYGKARGLSATERAKVTKSVRGSSTYSTPKRETNPKKVKKMAGKKDKTKKKRKFTLPMAIVVPLAATPFIPGRAGVGWGSPVDDARRGDYSAAAANYATGWVPIDLRAIQNGKGIQWHLPLYPVMLVAGAITHKVASFLGVNRLLGQAKVPIVRV